MSEAGLRWPNLFLVGAAKAGTTSLYRELARHPAIYMSPMKEPHFFSQIEPAPGRKAFFPHVTGEDEYLALFEGATTEELLGEASTSYLWDGQAAERIKRVVPEARILIMLRDPVDRAYSQYWNDVREGIERRTFLDALVEEQQRSGPGAWGVSSLHIDCGRYADQVERYLDRFGARVQVLFFEDFAGHEASAIADVHSFLGLGSPAAGAAPRRMNPASLPRNRLSAALLASGKLRRVVRATVPRPLRSRLRAGLLKRAAPPPMDPAARALLMEIYRPEVGRLAELLRRPVPWQPQMDGSSGPGLGKEGPGLDEIPVRAGGKLPPGGLP
ncbi:MAG: sulfotransferase [Actinomycetota bacterium]